MDTSKWKSVAVSVDNYKLLVKMAKENDRSISGQLAHIIKLLDSKKAA
jgi:predicted CopG family antitoxin